MERREQLEMGEEGIRGGKLQSPGLFYFELGRVMNIKK